MVRVQIRRDWGTGLESRALACPHGLQDPRVYGAHMQIMPPKGGVSSFKFRHQGTESYSFLLSPAWLVRSVTRVQVHVGEEWDSM